MRFNPVRPKRSAGGSAGLRFGGGQRDPNHALLTRLRVRNHPENLFHLTCMMRNFLVTEVETMRTWKGRRAVRGDYNFQWGRAVVNAVAKGGKSREKSKYVKL